MVSPQMYLKLLIKSISSSQQLWLRLVEEKAGLVKSVSGKTVFDVDLDLLRANLHNQLSFLDKVRKHIAYFSQWYAREDIEHMAFIYVKKSAKTIFSVFGSIQANAALLSSKISDEITLLENVKSSNFLQVRPGFLALYDEESQLLAQIEKSSVANDAALRDLAQAFTALSPQVRSLPVRAGAGVVELVFKTVVVGFAAYMLGPLVFPQEFITDVFGDLVGFVSVGAGGAAITETLRQAAALAAELRSGTNL